MKRMKAEYITGALMLLALTACQVFSGSTNEPPKGGSDRKYEKSPDEVSRAATEALGELDMNIDSDHHDALGGQIKATRSTSSADPVIIWYQKSDPRTTQVTVGVGKGDGKSADRNLAQMIQDHIAQKLGADVARGTTEVGARTEGIYDQSVAQCMAAAEKAMKDLKLEPSRKETHDTWAQVEARQTDTFPVSVRMNRTEKDKTQVSFSAGTSKSQDTEQIAERLKAEFERVLGSAK